MKHDPSDPAMWAKPKRKQTSTWKSVERKIARLFGVERNQDTHGEDFATDIIAVEVKHRSTLPKIVTDALEQVTEARPDRVPVAIFHLKGQRIEDSLCVMRAGDLKDRYHIQVGTYRAFTSIMEQK